MAKKKEEPMSYSRLLSLLCCTFITFKSTTKMMSFPIKTPPFLMALAACCICSCSSSGMLVRDTKKRLGI